MISYYQVNMEVGIVDRDFCFRRHIRVFMQSIEQEWISV